MADLRRSLALSFGEKYLTLVVQFGSSLVVARLITPEAFGAFSLAFSIVGFAHVIREMGVNNFIIRQPLLTEQHLRAALTATASVAWVLGLALLALCPLFERLYGIDVRQATQVLLLNFLLMPLGSTIFATLQREMDFAALFRINFAGAVANSASAVLLAYDGWGAMAFAWASVLGQGVTVGVAMAHRGQRAHYVPGLQGVREVVRFGTPIVLASILQQCSTSVATLITGRFVPLNDVGLLGRGQTVTGLFGRLIMDGIGPLVLPALAQLQREGRDLRPAFTAALDMLACVSWPFFLFLAFFADAIMMVLFGPQWVPAAPLLRLMSIGGLFWIVQPLANPLLVAVGRVDLTLRAQAYGQTAAVLGVLAAAPQGIGAVAAAGIVISAINGAAWLWCLRAVIPLGAGDLVPRMTLAGGVSVAALAPAALATDLMAGTSAIGTLALGGAAALTGWLAGIFLLRHPIAPEVRRVLHPVMVRVGGRRRDPRGATRA